MSLFGRLEDMPLSDIVQILSMAKRTGKLALTHGQSKAVMVFREGDVVYAASDSVRETLGHMLLRRGLITEGQLRRGLEIQEKLHAHVLLGTILVDIGAITAVQLRRVLVEQLEEVICELLTWKSGAFRFEPIIDKQRLTDQLADRSLLLADGASPEQLLLEASRRIDEDARDARPTAQPIPFPRLEHRREPAAPGSPAPVATAVNGPAPRPAEGEPAEQQQRRADALAALKEILNIDSSVTEQEARRRAALALLKEILADEEPDDEPASQLTLAGPASTEVALLRSIMDEIRSPSFTGEISLMILRFAAEVLRRGVLFTVHPQHLSVIGEFGVRLADAPAEQALRTARLPLAQPSLLHDAIETRQTCRGALEGGAGNAILLELLGGMHVPEAVAVPMVVGGSVVAVLYGDNAPDKQRLGSIDGLELLMIHASLGIEKAMLEQKVQHEDPS